MKKNEHIYIKKLEDHSGKEVWLVDGAAIRRDLDENFTKYEHHARLSFIPANEIWIEEDTNKDEWPFFLRHLDREVEYMKAGLTYDEAVKKADEEEQEKRYHLPRIQKILSERDARKAALEKIRKHPLPEYSTEKFTVWVVDGEIIRDLYMVGYADGGHDLVYSWVPKGEVWVEEVLPEKERKFIILHELHERGLMHGGKDYEHAHMGATIVEDRFREHPEEDIEARIREEMEKNMF